MNCEVYFDRPNYYKSKFDFYSIGSSPFLLKKFIAYLNSIEEEIQEINVALYLFNNEQLNDLLTRLCGKGVVVNVSTIPPEGYDTSNPKDIIDIETGNIVANSTKYDLAKKIFAVHYKAPIKNFNLYFFPHLYVRSDRVKKFARGNMPYSLHSKSFLIKKKNGEMDICISSSNFAVRDLVKEENLLIIKDEPEYAKPVEEFFNDLFERSLKIDKFDFKADYTTYHFDVKRIIPDLKAGFISPFYYNSPFIVEDILKKEILLAKEKIIIVAQHVCPVDNTFEGRFHSAYKNNPTIKREGFLKELLVSASAGIKIQVLSQTFASNDSLLNKKFRMPANKNAFINFYDSIKDKKNIQYSVNENVHSKYIIIDDKVFVTTFNFTPTQFIFLDEVKISGFVNNPGKSYAGIYSEVGQYVYLNDREITEKYLLNFQEILADKETVHVKK
ncbi:MAG TPA: hypothetical protein VKT28_01835 [Puia sp.]|nr:hypothetical protein [Puia sp.]